MNDETTARFLAYAREPLHDEEFVEQALHEKVVIQLLNEGRYAYCITSKCFQ